MPEWVIVYKVGHKEVITNAIDYFNCWIRNLYATLWNMQEGK